MLDDEGAEQSLQAAPVLAARLVRAGVGLVPPPGAETAHAELAAALLARARRNGRGRRSGPPGALPGVEPLLHEWRGALFRVRLARLRLTPPGAAAAVALGRRLRRTRRPLAAFLLALGRRRRVRRPAPPPGTWPVWAAGMLAVGASVVVYRP